MDFDNNERQTFSVGKIELIKIVRLFCDNGLVDAKQFVEAFFASFGIDYGGYIGNANVHSAFFKVLHQYMGGTVTLKDGVLVRTVITPLNPGDFGVYVEGK